MTFCRACKSRHLHLFLPLGMHPPANAFLKQAQLKEQQAVFPLDAYVCLDCGLIQVADHIPPDFFRNYVYVPSTSENMRRHFSTFADLLASRFLATPDCLAVDLGCNDGLLLSGLKAHGVRTLGVDPATNIIQMAREAGLEVVNEYFGPVAAKDIRAKYGPATVIVTTNTFHHVDDLDSFTEGVCILLADDGVFVIEVPHAQELVAHNEFDGIYHEHVSQFTVKSFVDLFARFSMEVFDVQGLEIHGGSVRVFVRKATGRGTSPSVAAWLERETQNKLFSLETYETFRSRVGSIRENLLTLLRGLKVEGKRLAGYGASARGNTLLNYYCIGPDLLDYIVDKNTLKHGLYTPGMHIPVYPVEKILEDRPDYVLLLAWNFADEVLRQQERYRQIGGKFILPIPEVKVVNGSGVGRTQ